MESNNDFRKSIISDEISYEGEYFQNQMQGKGKITNKKTKQTIYEGEFYKSEFNGYGTLYNLNCNTKAKQNDYKDLNTLTWTIYIGMKININKIIIN